MTTNAVPPGCVDTAARVAHRLALADMKQGRDGFSYHPGRVPKHSTTPRIATLKHS